MTRSMEIKSGTQSGGIARRLQVMADGGGRASLQRSLMGRGEPRPASSQRLVAEHRAKKYPRFHIGDGKGRFLLIDGSGVTTTRKDGWVGSEAQAAVALQRFAAAAGMRALRDLSNKMPSPAVPYIQ